MTSTAARPAGSGRAAPSRWAVALAGAAALAIAMGIGRFAFTPLLPMMLADGVIDLPGASWLASANYLGYLAGALLCTVQPWLWSRLRWLPPLDAPAAVRAGLVATVLLTLGMAVPVASAWPALRFAAGVASALVFVYTSGWCLALLAQQRATALGGVMYAGPGAGIVVTGLFASAMVAWHRHAAEGWLVFALLALLLGAAVWQTFRSVSAEPVGAAGSASAPAHGPRRAAGGSVATGHASNAGNADDASNADRARSVDSASNASNASSAGSVDNPDNASGADRAASATAPPSGSAEVAVLALAYGLAGFGYIITATFLPVIAREALPGSPWLDFFWPLFGLGVVAGALLSTRLRFHGDLRRLLAAAYLMQAAGVAASLGSPTLAGFAAGSLLLGVPFTAITFFAMQEVRRLRPASAPSTMALLTAMYGTGQIVGPPLVTWMLSHSGNAGSGFTRSLQVAAAGLLAGAVLYLWMTRVFPVVPAIRR